MNSSSPCRPSASARSDCSLDEAQRSPGLLRNSRLPEYLQGRTRIPLSLHPGYSRSRPIASSWGRGGLKGLAGGAGGLRCRIQPRTESKHQDPESARDNTKTPHKRVEAIGNDPKAESAAGEPPIEAPGAAAHNSVSIGIQDVAAQPGCIAELVVDGTLIPVPVAHDEGAGRHRDHAEQRQPLAGKRRGRWKPSGSKGRDPGSTLDPSR